MKKAYLLLFALFATAALATAQDLPEPEVLPAVFTLRLNALGFVNKARGQAEVTLGAVGLGAVGTYYYAGNFIGPKGEGYLRFYTGRRLAEGFYLQAKGGVGRYTASPVFDVTTTSYSPNGFLDRITIEIDQPSPERTFVAAGGGGGIGYQFRLGNGRRFVLDLYAGLQYVPLPKEIGGYSRTTATPGGGRVETEYDNTESFLEWYGLGPGSILNSMISVGYTFGGKGMGRAPRLRRYRPTPSPSAPEEPFRKAGLRQVPAWAGPGSNCYAPTGSAVRFGLLPNRFLSPSRKLALRSLAFK